MSDGTETRTRSQLLDDVGLDDRPRVLLIWQGGSTSLALPADATTLSVGRSKTADLRVEHPSVSRQHVTLHAAAAEPDGERRLVVQDHGSSNGTRVNGRRMKANAQQAIAPGDVVELGGAMLIVQRPGVMAPGVAMLPSSADRPSRRGRAEGAVVLGSASMQRLYRMIDMVAESRIHVLLRGETGVGKEVAAQAVHRRSPRAESPFVALNCASLPENLLESELFGYQRGAFTGADRDKPGLIESASGGTLLLDEVGELPLATQAKLLRVIEERELRRLGSLEPRAVDVRFVSATNRDLEQMVAEGRFRRDLFYRLNGIKLEIPPLRERQDDIVPLAERFLTNASGEHGWPIPPLTDGARRTLLAHAWPGNIRELKNVIERALVMSQGAAIEAERLAIDGVTVAAAEAAGEHVGSGDDLKSELAAIEKQRIIDALEQTGGNQTRAAELLGMSRRTFVKRLDEYGVPRPRKR